jgi:hypothetical protein
VSGGGDGEPVDEDFVCSPVLRPESIASNDPCGDGVPRLVIDSKEGVRRTFGGIIRHDDHWRW